MMLAINFLSMCDFKRKKNNYDFLLDINDFSVNQLILAPEFSGVMLLLRKQVYTIYTIPRRIGRES